VLLAAWVAAAIVATRIAAPIPLRLLHLVLAMAVVCELAAMSRIFGEVFFYLMLWSYTVTALMLVAIGWTVAVAVRTRTDRRVDARLMPAAFGVIVIVFAAIFAFDVRGEDMPLAHLGRGLDGVLPATERAMREAESEQVFASSGAAFLVTWADPIALGARGFAFVNELERSEFDIGVLDVYETAVRDHRVIDEPSDAYAEVHLAIGADIERWRRKPGAKEVAASDPRTPAQRRESQRLIAEVKQDLRDRGLERLVPAVDNSIYAAIVDPDMPRSAQAKLRRIGDLDLPHAVFIAPPPADE
jgi:hypothetical protein